MNLSKTKYGVLMIKQISALFFVVLIFTGCATKKSDHNQTVGSDKDVHGCIGSAGYTWCDRTKKCERPWELADQVGFENTEEAFLEYCE